MVRVGMPLTKGDRQRMSRQSLEEQQRAMKALAEDQARIDEQEADELRKNMVWLREMRQATEKQGWRE